MKTDTYKTPARIVISDPYMVRWLDSVRRFRGHGTATSTCMQLLSELRGRMEADEKQGMSFRKFIDATNPEGAGQ